MSCQFKYTVEYMPEYYEDSDSEEDIQERQEREQKIYKIFGEECEHDYVNGNFMCGLPVVEGLTICNRHKCQKEGCNEKIFHIFKYCKKHLCKYQKSVGFDYYQCESMTSGESRYCEEHKCTECNRVIFQDKTRSCQIHVQAMVCEYKDCQNIFKVDERVRNCDKRIMEMSRKIGGHFDNVEDDKYKIVCYCERHLCQECGVYKIEYDEGTSCKYCNKSYHDSEAYDRKNKCDITECKKQKLEDESRMGDLTFRTKYCKNHHILNEATKRLYMFELKMLDIYKFVDLSKFGDDVEEIKIIKKIKEQCDSLC